MQGNMQSYGIDYKDVFVPVARNDFLRLFLAVSTIHGLHSHQMEVSTSFLNGVLSENISHSDFAVIGET